MAKFARVNVSGILQRPGAAAKIIEEEARLMAEEVGKFGSERMKEYIRDRGTPFSRAAQAAGINKGPGRIRTGNMHDSVDYRVEAGPSRVSGAFGWIRNFEQYFEYQEMGFRNIFIASYVGSTPRVAGSNAGRFIKAGGPIVRKNPYGGYKNTPGMFALRDARADVQNEIPRLAQKYRSRITRKLNEK
jgi:hypothetical protein